MNIPDKIIKNLNITKEEKNVSIRSNSNNNSGSGFVSRIQVSKEREQNLKRGEIVMITAEGAKSDVEKLIVEAKDENTKLVLKAILVMIKVILTCRTNTVRIMEKLGVERETKSTPREVIKIEEKK